MSNSLVHFRGHPSPPIHPYWTLVATILLHAYEFDFYFSLGRLHPNEIKLAMVACASKHKSITNCTFVIYFSGKYLPNLCKAPGFNPQLCKTKTNQTKREVILSSMFYAWLSSLSTVFSRCIYDFVNDRMWCSETKQQANFCIYTQWQVQSGRQLARRQLSFFNKTNTMLLMIKRTQEIHEIFVISLPEA